MEKFSEYVDMTEGVKDDCAKLFERVVFGERLRREEDTAMEAAFWHDMQDWIAMPSLQHGRYKALFDALKKCKPYYKAQLMPDAKIGFRGTKIRWEEVLTKKWKESKFNMPNPHTHRKQKWFYIDISYKAKGDQQSWSKSRHTAHDFVRNRTVTRYEFGSILEMPVNKDFIFNSKTSNRLGLYGAPNDKVVGKHGEHEMIRIVNKPVKVRAHFSLQLLDRKILLADPPESETMIIGKKLREFGLSFKDL